MDCAAFCYLALLALPTHLHASTAKVFGAWDYALTSDDSGRPSRILARVRGEAGSALWISCSRVDDYDGGTVKTVVAAAVTQKAFLGPSRAKGRSTVTWIDDRPPEIAYWTYRDRSGQLTRDEEVKALVASLAKAEKLTIELSNYRLETHNVTFALNVSETQAVVEQFTRDCQSMTNRES